MMSYFACEEMENMFCIQNWKKKWSGGLSGWLDNSDFRMQEIEDK